MTNDASERGSLHDVLDEWRARADWLLREGGSDLQKKRGEELKEAVRQLERVVDDD